MPKSPKPARIGILQSIDTWLKVVALVVLVLEAFLLAVIVVLSQNVASMRAENQIIEGIQVLANGGPDGSRAARG
jgi:hypothetical protein